MEDDYSAKLEALKKESESTFAIMRELKEINERRNAIINRRERLAVAIAVTVGAIGLFSPFIFVWLKGWFQ